MAARIVQRHRERDGRECDGAGSSSEPENAPRHQKKIAEIKDFLAKNDKRRGPTGNEQNSNLTDPESAKMTSTHGVIQGYNGLAVVDGHAQVVVHAEAHGSGYEARLFAPLIEATRKGEARESTESKLFTVKDFIYDEANARCACPAGQKLYRSGKDMLFNGYRVAKFKAPPERTPRRQLTIIKHPEGPPPKRPSKCNEAVQRMRRKFDTPFGRDLYSRRMGTVEPVFGNIQNKGMRRFTLRGQKKVKTQCKLFTMVHNIETVAGVAKR